MNASHRSINAAAGEEAGASFSISKRVRDPTPLEGMPALSDDYAVKGSHHNDAPSIWRRSCLPSVTFPFHHGVLAFDGVYDLG